jgi:hypothetical protein
MTAIINSTTPSVQSAPVPFEVLLAKMQPQFEYFVGKVLRLKADNFDDAVQELIAIAFDIYQKSVRKGKQVFYTPIKDFAIKKYKDGRRFLGSSTTDLLAERTRILKRSDVCSLTLFDVREGSLHFMIDKWNNVSRTVQFKIDFFETWLQQQTERDRAIIIDLAMGETTGDVARKHGVSDGLISQYRKRYKASWNAFINPPEKTDLIDELKELADKEPA